MCLNRPEAWRFKINVFIFWKDPTNCVRIYRRMRRFRAHKDSPRTGSRPTSKDRRMLIWCYASRDQISSDSYYRDNHALIRPPQTPRRRSLGSPPDVRNTNIWYGFFRTGFRPSDRRQDFWISVTRSGSNFANNFTGDLTGYLRHWGQSRSSQERASQKSLTMNRVVITIGHVQGTVRSRAHASI